MQVDVPGCGNVCVWKFALIDDVVLGEENVALQQAAFARAANVGNPFEGRVDVFTRLGSVFECGEGPEDGPQIPVTDEFQIIDGVFIEA